MMRRHMQNISFLAIIGVLLSCAFFFSQQTKSNLADPLPDETVTTAPKVETLEDLPTCPDESSSPEGLACYSEAAEVSQRLVAAKVDEILALEPESSRRMAFMELQFAWEESRDADCTYVRELVDDPDQRLIEEKACLRDHNLDRLSQLENTLCDWYDLSSCQGSEATAP
jgi:uncharacterized protein YecT (DUF1311 family)